MKKIVFVIVFTNIALAASCQFNDNIQLIQYSLEKNNNPNTEKLEYFNDSHPRSIWANHMYYRRIHDTTYFLYLSPDKDTLYIANVDEFSARKIALESLIEKEAGGIWAYYYHNHDSIYFYIDRYFVLYCEMKKGVKYNDIILLDGHGRRMNEYSLDSMPDIYDGTLYGKLWPWEQHMPERMFAGGILVDVICKKPYVSNDEFAALNPRIMGLYDLKSKKIRMLNIKYPQVLFGKKYDVRPSIWAKNYSDDQLLIGFETLPYIYLYNLSEDSMHLIPANYDLHFLNVDSASMKKGKDYVSARFLSPKWCPEHSHYYRRIVIKHCKGYIPGRGIIEVLDSNFNHVGYVAGNGELTVGCSEDGKLRAHEKSSGNDYNIILENRIKHVNKTKTLHTFLIKRPSVNKHKINMIHYLEKMQIPDSSLIVIINLKYPCGGCLEQLLNFYKEHQSTMENRRMYYVFYDPDKSGLTKELMKRYGIKNARNILEDNKLLSNVNSMIPDKEYQNCNYIYLERHFQDGKSLLGEPTIEQLMSMLNKIMNNITNQ